MSKKRQWSIEELEHLLMYTDFSQDSKIQNSLRQQLLNPSQKKQAFFSLTWAVGLLVVVFVGGLLIFSDGINRNNNSSGASFQASATPSIERQVSVTSSPEATPLATVSHPTLFPNLQIDDDTLCWNQTSPTLLVVAHHDIPAGTILERNMLIVTCLPSPLVLPHAYQSVDSLLGLSTYQYIPAWSPIFDFYIVSPSVELFPTYIPTPTVALSGLTSTPFGEGCLPDLSHQVQIGQLGQVSNAIGSLRLVLRENPSATGNVISTYEAGTTFLVLDGPVCDNEGNAFFKVIINDGGEIGWFRESLDSNYVLEPVE